uniref:Ribosomal RNA-processing protein 8 n=1 Tax=Panagrellus redivivus TaxID=6233 RepID=A0A7E4UPV9_PANRE
MSEPEAQTENQKVAGKRKRPWRQKVRREAKKQKLQELASSETPESQSALNHLKETSKKKLLLKKAMKKEQKGVKKEVVEPEDKKKELVDRLSASQFRYLNEKLYTMKSKEAVEMFADDASAFDAYHKGYRVQVEKWPINPVEHIIKQLRKFPADAVVADLGCGEAKIAQKLSSRLKIHSFDLVAANEHVVACDMSKLPLADESVDVVVFCLSLMGTNLADFFCEANRILKIDGVVKIAEVWSRFKNLKKFLNGLEQMGFRVDSEKLLNDYFELITLRKTSKVTLKRPMGLVLEPCLYKKR